MRIVDAMRGDVNAKKNVKKILPESYAPSTTNPQMYTMVYDINI